MTSQEKEALMGYKQLTEEQRYQIYGLLTAGKTRSAIAEEVGVHKSTISREIKRNSGRKGYRPKQANERSLGRRGTAYKRMKLIPPVVEIITKRLIEDWSPDQISGRLKREFGITLSHETIYKFVANDKKEGGNLYTHLRQGHRKRKKRCGPTNTRGSIKNRISIEERPTIVDKKNRVGDFERDLIIGRHHKGAILTIVDRGTQLVLASKIDDKTSAGVEVATLNLLRPFSACIKTLTNDNGKEFADHESISKKLRIPVYFCHPYSSFERGLNENMNGLIRQYFPKKSDFRPLTNKDIFKVVDKLNNRPRKTLNYATPIEAFCDKYEKEAKLHL